MFAWLCVPPSVSHGITLELSAGVRSTQAIRPTALHPNRHAKFTSTQSSAGPYSMLLAAQPTEPPFRSHLAPLFEQTTLANKPSAADPPDEPGPSLPNLLVRFFRCAAVALISRRFDIFRGVAWLSRHLSWRESTRSVSARREPSARPSILRSPRSRSRSQFSRAAGYEAR